MTASHSTIRIKYVPIHGQSSYDEYFSVGRLSNDIYSIRKYYGKEEQLKVMVLDSSVGDSVLFPYDSDRIRGFAVSSDERFLAFSNDTDVTIGERSGGEWRKPRHPAGFSRLFEPSFSRDGQFLAAVAWGPPFTRPSGVVISHAPDFGEFVPLAHLEPYDPWSLCWSPDGRWLLVTVVRKREPIGAFDLIAVEAKSGRWFVLPELSVQMGEETGEIYSSGNVDWTE
ncbi:MAG: hypothetical protein HZB43_04060 [candidate division Zixibacteria bacterium]|nr:hypothetical protein [candidate division Zixibacteria bacterium]